MKKIENNWHLLIITQQYTNCSKFNSYAAAWRQQY
jgi:DICT domain-containing protein